MEVFYWCGTCQEKCSLLVHCEHMPAERRIAQIAYETVREATDKVTRIAVEAEWQGEWFKIGLKCSRGKSVEKKVEGAAFGDVGRDPVAEVRAAVGEGLRELLAE